MNNRGQIADGLTLAVAIFIVFLIMLVYLGFVGFVLPQREGAKVELNEISTDKIFVDSNDLAVKFYSENKDEVFDWIDKGEGFKDGGGPLIRLSGLAVEDKPLEYRNLLDKFSDFAGERDLENPFFYIRTEDKEFRIEYDNIDEIWEGYISRVEGNFEDNLKKGNNLNSFNFDAQRFFIVSPEGNLGMIVVYDKNYLEEEDE